MELVTPLLFDLRALWPHGHQKDHWGEAATSGSVWETQNHCIPHWRECRLQKIWRRIQFRKSLSPSHFWQRLANPRLSSDQVRGQEMVGWSLTVPCVAARSQGEGQDGGSLSLSHLCLVLVCCFSAVFVSLLLHPPFLFPSLLLHGIL